MEVNFTLEEIGSAARQFLANTSGRTVFAFHGEMGTGKTTFIHALCEAMQVKDHVSSPTFSIINQYTTVDGRVICHMDLYRLKDEQEAMQAGVEDALYSGNTCLVEWPEKAPALFPDDTLHVTITYAAGNARKLEYNL
jgi:tRNA threonylcarbamoyladenosine biosynthesis protein TsaE